VLREPSERVCPECDAVVDDGARYRANCGVELSETAARRRDGANV